MDAQTIVIPGIGVFDIPDFLAPQNQVAPPPDADKPAAEIAIEAARSKIGSGYSGGGNGPDYFDCSGLVQWAYRQAGVDLPRTSYEQLAVGTPVSLDELEPGDLVSFYGGGHSGLYDGNHQVVHASTGGRGVEVSDISEMPFAGARRY
nr:C40 family peptidase [Nocardia stercoris]